MLDLADVLKAAARKVEAVIATDYCPHTFGHVAFTPCVYQIQQII